MNEQNCQGNTIEAPILIVDDRPENLTAFRALLEPLGQPILEASSGDEALRRLLDGRAAVILMDVQMPGLDGLETAALIRKRAATAHIPIIFITALSRETHFVMKGYAQGAVDYLLKPVEPEILRTKVGCFVELYIRGELLRLRERELVERARSEEEAVRAAELEKQVSAMVGHDLRNPLSLVRLNAQLGLRTSKDSPHLARLFEKIAAASERLTHLTDDLLDFTRARLGRALPLERRALCLTEHVASLLEDFRSLRPDRDFELSAPDTLSGLWDSTRLSQVVQNLVENALKYGAVNAPIQVTLRRSDDRAELVVENDGEAIAEDKLPSLFDPFTQVEGRADAKSLGLGLFIVQEIARAHGGDVRAEPRTEGGMRFTVTLPLGPPLEDQRDPSKSALSEVGLTG